MESESFYKSCQQAISETINNAKFGGFSIDKALENLKNITTIGEWSKDYLFERCARAYLAICAAQAGYWSPKRRSGVLVTKDTNIPDVQAVFIENAEKDSEKYAVKAEKIKDEYGAVLVKNGQDGQLQLDTNDIELKNIKEEMTAERLIELILAAEGEK